MVYSHNFDLYLLCLRTTFEVLRANTLYAKRSKYSFGDNQVEFLGHIILENGMAMDPNKIEAMQIWPIPSYCHEPVKGIFWANKIYRKFIKHHGVISKPLIDLIRKNVVFGTLGQGKPSSPLRGL